MTQVQCRMEIGFTIDEGAPYFFSKELATRYMAGAASRQAEILTGVEQAKIDEALSERPLTDFPDIQGIKAELTRRLDDLNLAGAKKLKLWADPEDLDPDGNPRVPEASPIPYKYVGNYCQHYYALAAEVADPDDPNGDVAENTKVRFQVDATTPKGLFFVVLGFNLA